MGMVTAATSFGRSGVSDWLIQRFTAIVMLAYTVFIVFYLVSHGKAITYADWSALFSQTWMRVFSLCALLSIAAHAWIGLWVVLTDYVTERLMGRKALSIRMLVLGIFAIVTLAYVAWVIDILWGV